MHKKDKWVKEQLINDTNDDDEVMIKIRREMTAVKKTNEVTSKQVLA